MEEVKKKDILLNLADLDDTARVCRALSSETVSYTHLERVREFARLSPCTPLGYI